MQEASIRLLKMKKICQKSIEEYVKPKAEVENDILVLTIPAFTGSDKEAEEYTTILETALHKKNL